MGGWTDGQTAPWGHQFYQSYKSFLQKVLFSIFMDVNVTSNNDLICFENQLRQEVGDLRQEVNVGQPAGGDSSYKPDWFSEGSQAGVQMNHCFFGLVLLFVRFNHVSSFGWLLSLFSPDGSRTTAQPQPWNTRCAEDKEREEEDEEPVVHAFPF